MRANLLRDGLQVISSIHSACKENKSSEEISEIIESCSFFPDGMSLIIELICS